MSDQKMILVVEDQVELAEMFSQMLQISGFRVLHCRISQMALDYIENEKPDAIILDLMMPDFSGLEILKAVREREDMRGLPVIIVSAKSMPNEIKEGLDAGANAYLVKPVSFSELYEELKKVLKMGEEV